MNKTRDVHVYNHDNKLNRNNKCRVGLRDCGPEYHTLFNKEYQLFPANVHRQRYDWTREAGCQCNIKPNLTGYCSPKREEIVYYSGIPTQPKQVYAYSRARSFTDIGVGSVMVQQKKRIRKIYLPETENRGVGSTDLTPLIIADKRHRYVREDYPRFPREEYRYGKDDFYFPKKTSSKCVGGAVSNTKQCTEKLSPIICYIKSKGTGPNEILEVKAICKDTGNNTIDKNIANITTQVESVIVRNAQHPSRQMKKDSKNVNEDESIEIANSDKSPVKKNQVVNNVTSVRSPIKKYQESIQKSSDSLEQHVHNLEDPSFIPSTGSSDPMENKLEKEYRKMFSAKNKNDKEKGEKPIQDLKSASLLRRRFEALKRGIAKKEDNKKKETANTSITVCKDSSPAVESSGIVQSTGSPTRVDISVESDPPSLEARSFSQTKLFSPPPSAYNRRSRNVPRKKSHVGKKEKESLNWPPAEKKADDSDVQGMFKVWGEKFNFEGSKPTSPGVSFEKSPKEIEVKIKNDEPKTGSQEKREGKRFFFFKKKSKDKAKSPCKSKKGVTTGRCEVKNCLVLNGPPQTEPAIKYSIEETPTVVQKKSNETDDIIKKNWLQKFIQRTIESRKSLQIRWNNKTYTTSSSTVFELMDNVYRQTELIIRSQSETSTAPSSYYQSYNRHRVNFVQDIEAWMVPKLERDKPHNFFRRNDHFSGIKDRKWFIDKSKAFAHKIELVLHSKNFVKCHRAISSEYLRIDIPKGFFSDMSSESDRFATSNSEEVYKIIEYESPESRSEIKTNMKKGIGDCKNDKLTKKISVRDKNIDTRVIETVIKKPPIHRDVVIQGSNVNIPKRCDVIGVGIITHRDIRELGRTILKIDDDVSDEESEVAIENSIKQCEFAESYLREYYRSWLPLGIDIFSSCASDIYVKCETEESLSSINNQGDGTKSCPNLKDYNSTANIDPASSHSYPNKDTKDKSKVITTFKSLTQSEPAQDTKRVLPKDSFEVLKKRMLYACGNKAKWNYAEDQPYSVPSIQDKAEQDAINETSAQKPRKRCMKRVSITNCDFPSGDDSLPFHHPTDCKPLPGILSFAKKSSGSVTKHAVISQDDICDIEPATCKEFCETAKDPSCSIPPPKPKPTPPPKKSSKKSSSDSCPSMKCPPQKCDNICSCTCTPSLSSPLISAACSIQPITTLSPQNTRINYPPSNIIPQVPKEIQCSPMTSLLDKPCTCDPVKPIHPKVKPCTCAPKYKQKKNESPSQSPQRSPTSSPKQSPASPPIASPARRMAITPQKQTPPSSPFGSLAKRMALIRRGLSPNLSPDSPDLKRSPQQSTKSSESCRNRGCCPCRAVAPRVNTNDKSSQGPSRDPSRDPSRNPSQESIYSPNSSNSGDIQQRRDNKAVSTCPGSPCESRLADITRKAKSLPKMQGLHLKKKPAPNPPKCRSDCPKSASKDSIRPKKGKLKNPPGYISSPSDEIMLIRVKKETAASEQLREDVNVKVKDADGQTLYERRDYRADYQRETHAQPVLGEMYKVNRLATQNSEKMVFKEEVQGSSKSEASIANLIEISFGLKVTQGDKIAELNLGSEQGEMDKSRCQRCKPCNAEKARDVYMTSGEAEPTVDDPSDKNDINIKIVIKNFKTKTDKPVKHRKNDEFSRQISQKFQTVSTGYSDIIPDNIDNMYSIHRTTIDLTASKSQVPLDVSGDQEVKVNMENIETKTNTLEDETVRDILEKTKVPEEIKKNGSLDYTEVIQIHPESNKKYRITESDKSLNVYEIFKKAKQPKEIKNNRSLDDTTMETNIGEIIEMQSRNNKYDPQIESDKRITEDETLLKAKKPEIKNNGSSNYSTLNTRFSQVIQMQSETNNVSVTESDKKLCKCTPGEIKKFNINEFQNSDTFSKVKKTDTYAVLQTEDMQAKMKDIIYNNELDAEEVQKAGGESPKMGEEIQKTNNEIFKPDIEIQKPDEDNNVTIRKIETCEVKHKSEITDKKAGVDKMIQDTKSDINNRMHTLTPILNSVRDIKLCNTEKSKETSKLQCTKNSEEIQRDKNESDKVETNMIWESECPPATDDNMHMVKNEVVISQENNKGEEITASDIIKKNEVTSSILEKNIGTENDEYTHKNETMATSHATLRSISVQEKPEINQTIQNTEEVPRISNEIEEIIVGGMMLKSDLIKDRSESGEIITVSKNGQAVSENKSGIEKCCTSITIELKFDARETLQGIENYEDISESDTNFKTGNNSNIETKNDMTDTEHNTNISTVVTCGTVRKYVNAEVITEPSPDIANDLLISETMQVIENWESEIDEKDITCEKNEAKNIFGGSDKSKNSQKQTYNDEIANKIKNFENFLKIQKRLQYPTDFHKPVEITPDIDICEESQIMDADNIAENTYKGPKNTEDERNLNQGNAQTITPGPTQQIQYSETRLSHSDTDDQENNEDLANASDDLCENIIELTKPHSKREKKEMLKNVFEKATTQKWKTKGRMKRLRNMLKFILTSDSSEVEEPAETSKDLMKDVTYSTFDPNYFRTTDSMTNYYRIENVVPSDDENKMARSCTGEQSEDSKYSDSSEYQSNVSKCVCDTMAETIKKLDDTVLTGCCCKPAPNVHEQTSCNMTNDQGLYMVNYKAAEYIDVQTQNSIINSRVTNVMVMKKMESVMTSKTSSEIEKNIMNSTVSPYKDDKICEAKNVKTNTMLGLIDDGKIIIRTSDENKMSLQTEILIGWKGKDKKKQKRQETVYFAHPSDVLQSYETKKAVLEIYSEKTVSAEGEKLVAKLPKFLYEKEEEIETNYVKNVLLAHNNI